MDSNRRRKAKHKMNVNSRAMLSVEAAVDEISKAILSKRPFLAGKIGETEMRMISFDRGYRKFSLNGYRIASYDLCNNAGFFPRDPFKIRKWSNYYTDSMHNIDYLGRYNWKYEDEYVENEIVPQNCMPTGVLDVLTLDKKWTSALEGKTVLVIHPFAESISNQYKNKRTKIFSVHDDILPEYNLKTIKAVQSIGGRGAIGYKSWFCALDDLIKQIDRTEFDVALLGCGCYGMPLGGHIKAIGKQAIYCGGSLQLMYGIMGARWKECEYVTKNVNENWIRPSDDEKPSQYFNVENGCYW